MKTIHFSKATKSRALKGNFMLQICTALRAASAESGRRLVVSIDVMKAVNILSMNRV